MTPAQCRAARSLLGWTQTELAHQAGVGRSTVTDFELDSRRLSAKLVAKIRRGLEKGGIEFSNSKGVRLK